MYIHTHTPGKSYVASFVFCFISEQFWVQFFIIRIGSPSDTVQHDRASTLIIFWVYYYRLSSCFFSGLACVLIFVLCSQNPIRWVGRLTLALFTLSIIFFVFALCLRL